MRMDLQFPMTVRALQGCRCPPGPDSTGKHFVFLWEHPLSDAEDAVRDEKGGEDVNGVVQVAEQHRQGEDNGRDEEDMPEDSIFPEGEAQEERKSGMAGEEQVARKS